MSWRPVRGAPHLVPNVSLDRLLPQWIMDGCLYSGLRVKYAARPQCPYTLVTPVALLLCDRILSFLLERVTICSSPLCLGVKVRIKAGTQIMTGRSSSSEYYTEVNVLIALTNFISLYLCLSIISVLSVSGVAMATSRAGAAMRHPSHPSRWAHRKREEKCWRRGRTVDELCVHWSWMRNLLHFQLQQPSHVKKKNL